MAKKDPLFEPLTIGNLTLKNRIMSTSHASGMDDDGMPGERYQRYHEEKAKEAFNGKSLKRGLQSEIFRTSPIWAEIKTTFR